MTAPDNDVMSAEDARAWRDDGVDGDREEIARLCDTVIALHERVAAARRDGAEAMREACAQLCVDRAAWERGNDNLTGDADGHATEALDDLATTIRALPLPDGPDGDLRGRLAEAQRLLAAAARGELRRCAHCEQIATRLHPDTGEPACLACLGHDADEAAALGECFDPRACEELPQAAGIRAALRANPRKPTTPETP